MSVGVVPHYVPYLLVNCHCNQHFTSRVQTEEGWLQVWCYLYRGAIISDMSDNPVPLSDMPSCTMQLLSDMHAGVMNSSTHVCNNAALSRKVSGLLQIHQICLQVGCRSHRLVNLVQYHPGRNLEYIIF